MDFVDDRLEALVERVDERFAAFVERTEERTIWLPERIEERLAFACERAEPTLPPVALAELIIARLLERVDERVIMIVDFADDRLAAFVERIDERFIAFTDFVEDQLAWFCSRQAGSDDAELWARAVPSALRASCASIRVMAAAASRGKREDFIKRMVERKPKESRAGMQRKAMAGVDFRQNSSMALFLFFALYSASFGLHSPVAQR